MTITYFSRLGIIVCVRSICHIILLETFLFKQFQYGTSEFKQLVTGFSVFFSDKNGSTLHPPAIVQSRIDNKEMISWYDVRVSFSALFSVVCTDGRECEILRAKLSLHATWTNLHLFLIPTTELHKHQLKATSAEIVQVKNYQKNTLIKSNTSFLKNCSRFELSLF